MHLEIDEGFTEHPKTLRFAGLLKDPNAPWMVLRLWRWACRSAKDGSLAGMEPMEIEMAAGYRQLDGACYAALARAGFIDERDGKPHSLHNWMKRTGAAIVRMEAEADRKRWVRAHHKGICGGSTSGCPMCASIGRPSDNPEHELDASAARPPPRPANGGGRPDTVQSSPVQSSQDPEIHPPAPARSDEPDAVPPQQPRDDAAKLTGHRLLAVFGSLREEHVEGTLPWVSPRLSQGKADDVAAEIASRPDAVRHVAHSIALFFGKAKAGQYGKDSGRMLKDPTFGFSCWASKFQALVEEIRGVTPAEPPTKSTGPPRTGQRNVRVGYAPAPEDFKYPEGEQKL